ncbi:T9SS type A sorting domain-containing protein [Neolewinella agarilytica]|uniref:T9SS type A sorting domain-containing protein n=1 Tax=Neolewinella agarilytica TaxID=478744 RepID=UPI00235392FB|nr:T9SS type A sorting domain-containing protein [Neolewinella agarilytica]
MHYLKILSLLSFVLIVDLLSAQGQFAPPGAEWCLRGYDGEEETIGFVLVKYERDTLVRGVPTKIMSIRSKNLAPSGLVDGYYSGVELIQHSRDSVFYYVPEILDRVFLFKESYELGEETTTWLYNEPFNVLEVEETVIDGVEIPVAKMNLPAWLGRDLPVTMYGALGPDRGFMENWSYYLDGLGGVDMEAYRASNTPEIKIVARSQCFALMEQEVERVITRAGEDECSVVAFPNPVATIDEWVRLRLDCRDYVSGNFLLRVYSVDGKEAMPPKWLGFLPNDFAVGSLANGKYIGVISGEGERYTFTFVKNR